jgi:hypothetical protein
MIKTQVISLFIMFLFLTPANAWKFFGETANGQNLAYYQPETLLRKDDTLSVWVLIDHKRKQINAHKNIEWRSETQHAELNCKSHKVITSLRNLHQDHEGAGRVVFRMHKNIPVTPPIGSFWDQFIEEECR